MTNYEKLKKNTILCKQVISLSRKIQENLNTKIIAEGTLQVIEQGLEWLRECLSLLSKQSNLFESCILLLENNMEQEAFILARSQFNNMLWISYICNGDDNFRIKEYFYEQHITKLKQLIYIKKYLKNLSSDVPNYDKFSSIDLDEIDKKINITKDVLRREGYKVDVPVSSISNKKIISLTEFDPLLLGLYNSFYNEASKYEHADITTTSSFRKTVVDSVSTDYAFEIELSKSDLSLWKTVMNQTLTILYFSIEKIYERIKNKEPQLFEYNQFDEISFTNLVLNIKIACDTIELIEE